MSNSSTIRAVLVPADLTLPCVPVTLDANDPLASMYPLIGCQLVQPTPTARDHRLANTMLWVDEEGLCVAEPKLNIRASMLGTHNLYGDAIFAGDNGENIIDLDLGDIGPEIFFSTLQFIAEDTAKQIAAAGTV